MVLMHETVLKYPKLNERLQKRPEDREKALSYLKEIATSVSPKLVDNFGKILDHTLMKLYHAIDFEVPSDINFSQLIKENNVIFVPNHQSHADYLVLSYLVYRHYKIIPLIAGGINLNVFPIGTLFRKSGCFFIRRSFHNNILYKLTLEAYIYYLLEQRRPIEFFYEGGRSRTGKLMAPKYGLFQMLLECHQHIPEEKRKPLIFIPISIVHELVPEQKTLTKEMGGAKKKKESFSQLLKLYKFVKKQFGTIHIKMNPPVTYESKMRSIKLETQDLAFRCYREVGKGIKITPASILVLILLDEPSGQLTWETILNKAKSILSYCYQMDIPISLSLKAQKFEDSLKQTLDMLIHSNKINVLHNTKLGQTFYQIEEDARIELLYSKNTILHHFLAPFFINSIINGLFNGTIKDIRGLKHFLTEQRNFLKFEFYLPTIKDLFNSALKIVLNTTGNHLSTPQEMLNLSTHDLYKILAQVAPFTNAFRYIYESYYISTLALKFFKNEQFSRDEFYKISKEIFLMEKSHGRFIKFEESYTLPTIKNAFNFFLNYDLVKAEQGSFYVPNQRKIEELLAQYAKKLTDSLVFNLELFSS